MTKFYFPFTLSEMLRKFSNLVLQNPFLRSSSVVFGANLLTGVCNYALVIIAARALGDDYSIWTALTGLFAILTTFNNGFYTEVNKKFAAYAKQSRQKALAFYDFLLTKARVFLIWGVVVAPVLGGFLWWLTQISAYPVYAVLVFSIFLGIYAGINRFFLIGLLHNFQFGIVTLVIGIARLTATYLLFEAGVGIWALPLGLILSQIAAYLVAKIYIERIRSATKNPTEVETSAKDEFTLLPHLIASTKSTVILFFLALFLNLAPILSERTLLLEERDLFAVLFNFGQIIHFGSTAFTQAIIVHAARAKGNKIYYFSIGLMTALTSVIGGLFYFAGEFMLGLFGKSQYADSLDLILYYSLFIVFYNVIFISVQYLLSHSKYRFLSTLPLFCAVLITVSFLATRTDEALSNFILAQIITGAVVGLSYVFYIVRGNNPQS